MTAFGAIFGFHIFSLFSMYRVMTRIDETGYSMAVSNFVWSIYFTLMVLCIIGSASAATREGQRTAVYVHKAILYCRDLVVIEKVIYMKLLYTSACSNHNSFKIKLLVGLSYQQVQIMLK